MTKTTIASIVFGCIACIAMVAAAFVAGRNAGREQTDLDRLKYEVREFENQLVDVSREVDELKAWRNRWGAHGAPGDAQ